MSSLDYLRQKKDLLSPRLIQILLLWRLPLCTPVCYGSTRGRGLPPRGRFGYHGRGIGCGESRKCIHYRRTNDTV